MTILARRRVNACNHAKDPSLMTVGLVEAGKFKITKKYTPWQTNQRKSTVALKTS